MSGLFDFASTAAYFAMAIENEADVKWDETKSETIEQIETKREGTTHEQIEELSALEATAASKAAWLISITVSLGGLLFGMAPSTTSNIPN